MGSWSEKNSHFFSNMWILFMLPWIIQFENIFLMWIPNATIQFN
jgi:hypothetical protein